MEEKADYELPADWMYHDLACASRRIGPEVGSSCDCGVTRPRQKENDKMDTLDIAQIVSTTPFWTRLVVKLWRRQFNRVASRVILRAYERGRINSAQMHILCAQFDPTQRGVVGSL